MERAIMNQSRTVRLPVYVIKELNVVLRAMRELDRQRGADNESPGVMLDEVSRLLDRPVDEVRHLLMLNERSASLDSPLDIDPELSMSDAMADEIVADPATRLPSTNRKPWWRTGSAQLTDRQRLVIERRYGLGGNDATTLELIARDLGPDPRTRAPDPDGSAVEAAQAHCAGRPDSRFATLTAQFGGEIHDRCGIEAAAVVAGDDKKVAVADAVFGRGIRGHQVDQRRRTIGKSSPVPEIAVSPAPTL
jgi:hypothetical protein